MKQPCKIIRYSLTGRFVPLLSLAFLSAMMNLTSLPVIAQETKQTKIDKIKTSYLLNFINFSRWPKKEPQDTQSPIHISVIGDESYAQTLNSVLRSNRLGNRLITIKSIVNNAFSDIDRHTISNSHVVYVRQINYANMQKLLAVPKPVPFLLIGDPNNFASNGGMIGFRVSRSKVRFEINTQRIHESSVQISSKIMRLGIQIKNKE